MPLVSYSKAGNNIPQPAFWQADVVRTSQ